MAVRVVMRMYIDFLGVYVQTWSLEPPSTWGCKSFGGTYVGLLACSQVSKQK